MSERSHAILHEWLALYYDDELDARRREQMEAHLLGCISCQQELAALKALSSVLAVDRLEQDALANQSVSSAWRDLEPHLPDRAATAPSLLRWLPGIGLLIANVALQFIAVVSVLLMLSASRLGWIAQAMSWLDASLSGWLLGWITWLLPIAWSGWGLSLFVVIQSAWLAVLSVVWMGWVWLDRRPVLQMEKS